MSKQPLLTQSTSPTMLHYLAMFIVSFSRFGESVEFMLPAVVTQSVSCDLALSKKQEHILALAQYASAAISSLISIPFLQKFPRKPIILFSLYMAVLSAIICAIVPNYFSLLLSRILVGITIAVGSPPLNVYLSEISPNKKFYLLGTVLTTVGWTIGGGWCGTLGYLFLERVGWRWFVLLTSVPLFIPSIVAFHFFLPESKPTDEGCNRSEAENVKTCKRSMILRMVKVMHFNFFRGLPYFGSILLLPAIFKEDNIKNDLGSFCNAIQGTQFLVITLVYGGCHLLGKGVGYATHRLRVPTLLLFAVLSFINTLSLVIMQIYDDRMMVIVANLCVIHIILSACQVEVALLSYDAYFFTPTFLPISAGILQAFDFVDGVIGNTISEILQVTVALKIFTATSIGMLISSFFFC